uniref:Uncharacterized protein n=1 Tax=Hyaloperonospora arabidopsidis (strain Emoy2) TaxID=559515 RepID=M4C0L8_HYAAE
MTVRSIVEKFERMAAAAIADSANHLVGSAERGNVQGLVTYYDRLADVKVPSVIETAKDMRQERNQHTEDALDEEMKEVEQEQEEQEQEEQEQDEQGQEQQDSKHESSGVLEVTFAPLSSSSTLVPNFESKIREPKSRERHLKIHSVRRSTSKGVSRGRVSPPSSNGGTHAVYVQPPAPVSSRVRAPVASYAAFAARIENSQSRLLEFEKDERWLVQVETMKGRVEALKRKSQLAFAREVVASSSSRKTRSLSECSSVSTGSTASMSSMDTLEGSSCQ